MKMYIPSLGDHIELLVPWTFDLYNEERNQTLMRISGDNRNTISKWQSSRSTPEPCTVPAGAILIIDRIYIKKGLDDYDSITFRWHGRSTEPYVEKCTYSHQDIKYPRKPVRFWAKLADVNKIEFRPVTV